MSDVLKINGSSRTFEEGLPSSLEELLSILEIDAATVVAEIDGRIIERKDFAQTVLHEAQSIELIRFVGGG